MTERRVTRTARDLSRAVRVFCRSERTLSPVTERSSAYGWVLSVLGLLLCAPAYIGVLGLALGIIATGLYVIHRLLVEISGALQIADQGLIDATNGIVDIVIWMSRRAGWWLAIPILIGGVLSMLGLMLLSAETDRVYTALLARYKADHEDSAP